MKSIFSNRVRCASVLFTLVLLSATALNVRAFPIITNVVETGGDNEATDTVTAKWTGVTFVNGIANEPVPGRAAGDPYTVGVFGNHAPCFVDRNHRWTNASDTAQLPSYLVGQEYIMSGNDNRDNNPGYRLDVSVATPVFVYMLIDNRLGGNNADPPTFGPTTMQWILDEGWLPVTNGINRNGSFDVPDEVAVDEGADGTLNQWSSIYMKSFPAGTFQLKQPDNAGQNMYGVVVASAVPPATPTNVAAVASDGRVTLTWTGTGGAYIVKRSVTAGGPYDSIATNLTTSYVDTDVFNTVTYYYVISAFNGAGETPNSLEVSATPNTSVTGVTAVGGTNRVTVSWDAFPGASTYTVLRSAISGGPYTSVGTGITGTTFTDSTAPTGVTSYYVVRAQLAAGGSSGQSSETSAVTAPSAPVITAAPWAVTALQIRWAATNEVVTGYSVEQSSDGVNFAPIATPPPTPRYHVSGDLAPNSTYYYRVQAQNASGFSPYSAVVSARTPASGFNVNFANAINGTPANNPAPTPLGYAQDIGEAFGPRPNGWSYGWNTDITVDSRWRMGGASPDIRWATFNHLQKPQVLPTAIWEIEIPNGFYSVFMVAGDAENVDSVFQFDLEGVITTNSHAAGTSGNFGQFHQGIGVSDGRLTIMSGPQAANNKINFIDIYPAVPTPPVIATQPQNTAVEEYHPLNVSVGMSSGSVPFVYQWFRNGTPVSGGTNQTLSIPHPRTTDSGTYTVVITNWGGTVTSTVATVTVRPDTNAPVVTSLFSVDGDTINIFFSEELDNAANQVSDPFTYTITSDAGVVFPTNVVICPDKQSVVLDLDVPVTGNFRVSVNEQFGTLRDLAQNPMPATVRSNTVIGFAGDVGNVALPGAHFTCDGEDFEIIGGGADIWGNADAFHLVSRPVNGNFDARVQVTSLTGADITTKAVLVARENNNADARALHISVNPTPPGRNQLELGARTATGGATAAWGGTFVPANVPNVWMRITRNANTFVGYRSTNGVDWIAMGTTTLALPADIAVGIGVTAHNNSLLATGVFSSFRVSQLITAPSLGNLTYNGTQFGMSFATEAGVAYHVEYKNDLNDATWTLLNTVTGTGATVTISDPTATVPRRFYRVRF